MSKRSRTEVRRVEGVPAPRTEPYMVWCGGLACIVLAVGTLVLVASLNGWLQPGSSPPAVALEQLAEIPQLADRANCAEIGSSDLRSPAEGHWFQNNCVQIPTSSLITTTAGCGRESLDPVEFTEVSPGLFVFRQTQGSPAYLWYASSETCFDLVSARVVTAVCANQTVSFDWNASACSVHGGVLAWVNGR